MATGVAYGYRPYTVKDPTAALGLVARPRACVVELYCRLVTFFFNISFTFLFLSKDYFTIIANYNIYKEFGVALSLHEAPTALEALSKKTTKNDKKMRR